MQEIDVFYDFRDQIQDLGRMCKASLGSTLNLYSNKIDKKLGYINNSVVLCVVASRF